MKTIRNPILIILLSMVFTVLKPLSAHAAEAKYYRWGTPYLAEGEANPGQWYLNDEPIAGLPSPLGSAGDEVYLSFYAPSTASLNSSLQAISNAVPIAEIYLAAEGSFIIGSSSSKPEVSQLVLASEKGCRTEIHANVEAIYAQSYHKAYDLTVHGNVQHLDICPYGADRNLSGNIIIDGNVRTLNVQLKAPDAEETADHYYEGSLTVKGIAESTTVIWCNPSDLYYQTFGSTRRALQLADGRFADEDDVPIHTSDDTVGRKDIILYGIDGKKTKLSDLKTDYVSYTYGAFWPGENGIDPFSLETQKTELAKELAAAKANYGISLTTVISLENAGQPLKKLSAADLKAIQSAFPNAVVSCYPAYAEKADALFADVQISSYMDLGTGRTDLYDSKGKNILTVKPESYQRGMILRDLFHVYEKSGSEIDVDYHSITEIKAFIKAHPFTYTASAFDITPSPKAPYAAGKLSRATVDNALNCLNQIRYIAGLNHDVANDEEYEKMVQAGTLVDAAIRSLTHYPGQPSDMDDALYQLGASGASSSNLAVGFGSLPSSIIGGWMSDSDAGNIDRVGHRRWCLSPAMGATGFGNVQSYTGMYAFDRDGLFRGLVSAWPAQNTPIQYFAHDDPWSYSSGIAESGSITVTMKRENTNETWTFSKSSVDGYFNVDNGGYGINGCVIWRPKDITYHANDVFDITISGLKNGKVHYHVTFFDLSQPEDSDFNPEEGNYTGWYYSNGRAYWYEDGKRQGIPADHKCFSYDGSLRGREIYDPESDGWYWLDVIYDGAKAVNKEVYMPYIYQDEADHLRDDAWINAVASLSTRTSPENVDLSAQIVKAIRCHGGAGSGKWVRYDKDGRMIKGWYTVEGSDIELYPAQAGNTYYYDRQTGLMAKGNTTIDGYSYYFNEVTGVLEW